jgi:hypothetical protein
VRRLIQDRITAHREAATRTLWPERQKGQERVCDIPTGDFPAVEGLPPPLWARQNDLILARTGTMRTCSGKPPDLRRGPEPLPFGMADRSPQHHLDCKCCNPEAPQNYGRELFWDFIDLRQYILDDRDDPRRMPHRR